MLQRRLPDFWRKTRKTKIPWLYCLLIIHGHAQIFFAEESRFNKVHYTQSHTQLDARAETAIFFVQPLYSSYPILPARGSRNVRGMCCTVCTFCADERKSMVSNNVVIKKALSNLIVFWPSILDGHETHK